MNVTGALEVAELSDVGRFREHNEDSTAVDLGIGLTVVADGMGGYRAGEVASAIAVTTVVQELRRELSSLVHGQRDPETGLAHESLALRDALARANERINSSSRAEVEHHGMGTTAVAMLFYDDRATIAHVGDSRAYRWRDGALEQMTNDHTVVQDLIDNGMYTPEEAAATVNRNLVTRALGIEPRIDADVREIEVAPGDTFMLCTDGLTGMVDDHGIGKVLSDHAGIEEASRHLVRLANQRGGEDNVSVILVRVDKPFPAGEDAMARLLDWFK